MTIARGLATSNDCRRNERQNMEVELQWEESCQSSNADRTMSGSQNIPRQCVNWTGKRSNGGQEPSPDSLFQPTRWRDGSLWPRQVGGGQMLGQGQYGTLSEGTFRIGAGMERAAHQAAMSGLFPAAKWRSMAPKFQLKLSLNASTRRGNQMKQR
jgi:hypothetical protein